MKQNGNNYYPTPIDTTDVVLPQEILDVAETLSKNTHEVWASGKIKEGFIYDTVTDDTKKTHNCLIPYDQLSETEKEYDLNTALETVRLLLKLGFRIERTGTEHGFRQKE